MASTVDLRDLANKLNNAGIMLGDGRTGDLVMKVGRVAKPVWNIRHSPQPHLEAFTQLKLNDVVLVERSMTGRAQDTQSWLYVYAQPAGGEKFVEGWVNSAGLLLDPPEPEAQVHFIKSGEKLIDIAAKYYKGGGFAWGDDARFYVAALAYANKDYSGLIFPKGWTDADFKERGRWADVGIKADHALWIPAKTHLALMKGQFVSSGSITYAMWQAVKMAAAAAWEVVVGFVGFVAGLIHGLLLSIYDLLADLIDLAKMVWKVLKSLFTGELINDVKKLWNALKNTDWKSVLVGLATDFMAKWEAEDPWARHYFRGKVLGWILGTVALALLTAGISLAGKAGKFAKVVNAVLNNPAVKAILDNPAVKAFRSKAEEVLGRSTHWLEAKGLLKRAELTFDVLEEGPKIPNTSIPEWLRLKVGKREWRVERNATKLDRSGKPIGPATKHLGEKAQGAGGFAKLSQVDFPISSLAGALEEAERRLLAKTAHSGTLFTVEGWELGISTKETVWRVYHAVYDPTLK
jgi:hypothetical protein